MARGRKALEYSDWLDLNLRGSTEPYLVFLDQPKVADGNMIDAMVHGEETIVLGDRAYTRNDRNLEAQRQPEEPVWGMPFKRKSGEELPAEHAVLNRMLASLRAKKLNIRFVLSKDNLCYTKVRYRGLFKNAQQLYLLFALANLY